MLTKLPAFDDWDRRRESLKLERKGRELNGPCPHCGGEDRYEGGKLIRSDRFRVNQKGFFCRKCCPDGTNFQAALRIAKAAFPALDIPDDLTPNRDYKPPAQERKRGNTKTPEATGSSGPTWTDERIAALWRACERLSGSDPASLYLASRKIAIDSAMPFERIRWLPGAAAKKHLLPRKMRLPARSAGAIAFGFSLAGVRTMEFGQVKAVSVRAVSEEGKRIIMPDGGKALCNMRKQARTRDGDGRGRGRRAICRARSCRRRGRRGGIGDLRWRTQHE